LHDHFFSNIIFYLFFDLHWVRLRSCVRLGAGAWLFICLMIPFYWLASKTFSIALRICLGLPHPLVLGFSHCICGQLLDPIGIHLLHCAHGGERTTSHDVMWDAFVYIVKDAWLKFYVNTPTFFRCLLFNQQVNGSTLWFWWMVFRCWLTSSLLTPHEEIWFCG
jgi:hypothetical protein